MSHRDIARATALVALFAASAAGPVLAATNDPGWWISRGVINTNAAVTNDYAAATAGQVKWFATNAYDELEAHISGGAGPTIANLVSGFPLTNNFLPVNAGQLKYVAAPFYDRLIAVDYTNSYPWTSTSTDDVSYALVNVGQVKYLFNFEVGKDEDLDGLADWWENKYGFGPYAGVTTNLTGWWRFREAEGPTVHDSSGYGNSGTATNMSPWPRVTSCPSGSALDFDGAEDYIAIPHSASLMPTSAVSVTAWVYLDSWGLPYGDGSMVVCKTETYGYWAYFLMAYGDAIYFQVGSACATAPMATGTWTHVAGTYDGTNLFVYVNGIAGAPVGGSGPIPNYSGDLLLGAYNDSGYYDYLLDGKLADVRVYTSALSAQTITNLSQTGATDYDGDGLSNSNEYWLGTCPTSSDSDGDGLADAAELAAGTDPLDASSFLASISGTLSYNGCQTGQLWVVAVTSSASWSTNHGVVKAVAGAYSITNLPNLRSWWIKAWCDVNGNSAADTNNEAYAQYLANPVCLTTNRAGVNISLGIPRVTIVSPVDNLHWRVLP